MGRQRLPQRLAGSRIPLSARISDIVDAFIEIQDECEAIAQRHADTEADMQRKIDYMVNAIVDHANL